MCLCRAQSWTVFLCTHSAPWPCTHSPTRSLAHPPDRVVVVKLLCGGLVESVTTRSTVQLWACWQVTEGSEGEVSSRRQRNVRRPLPTSRNFRRGVSRAHLTDPFVPGTTSCPGPTVTSAVCPLLSSGAAPGQSTVHWVLAQGMGKGRESG